MEFFQRVKRKIDDGFLQEFAGELRWLWQYIRRYRATVAIHILLGVLGILMSLGSSVASKHLITAPTRLEMLRIAMFPSRMPTISDAASPIAPDW